MEFRSSGIDDQGLLEWRHRVRAAYHIPSTRSITFLHQTDILNSMYRRLVLGFLLVAFHAPRAFAQTIDLDDPLNGRGFDRIATALVDALVLIGFPIAAIMVVVGAIQLMTSGGKEDKISDGKKTITYAAIGYGVILSWKLIIDIVREILSV